MNPPIGKRLEPPPDPDFEALLEFLRDSRGVDFTGYKRTSLRRLVERRMLVSGAHDVRYYLDRLQVDPAEVAALFDTLLINVTAFRRDPTVWESLETGLVPALLQQLGDDEPVRVWSAACATGEEAYSLAMLLHTLLGQQAFLERVKIYATDLDEAALTVARTGRYPRKAVAELAPELVEQYFTADGDDVVFRKDLRQNVIFGRHDLLADAPISRVALLTCRNTLMYFTSETQARILERFAFALHEHGLLVLGRAEMLLTHNDLFVPADLGNRVFRVARRPDRRRETSFVAVESTLRKVAEASFTSSPDSQLVLDRDQVVVLVNDAAVQRLGLARSDVGRPFADLDLSYAPVELRGPIRRVLDDGQPQSLTGVRWERRGGADSWWDVRISLLPGRDDDPLGVQIVFTDVTRYHELSLELTQAHSQLRDAYEELQSSGEELETTNEELQSAIEELETTNEELQSTNEELETMNEELQSTNEELQTVNDELRERTSEVGEVNAFLESIVASLRTALVVVDVDYRVLLWNVRAERMWGLRAFEVQGRHLLQLDSELPVEALRDLARNVILGQRDLVENEVVLTNRFGRPVLCSLGGAPLRDGAGDVRGAIITIEEQALDPDPLQPETSG